MKNKLLKARLKKGYSQEEIADLLGMSQSNYSRREKGLKKISDEEWSKIAFELGVKKEDIYEEGNLDGDFSNGIKNNSEKIYQFNIPDFIIEHIELLKQENKALKERLKRMQ